MILYDVFLSYASGDKIAVRELAERLRADGLRVWFDEWEIRPADLIQQKINEGLEASQNLILIMSTHSFHAEWVTLESSTFRFRDPTNKERRFIPLRLDNAEIPMHLRPFSYVDWRKRTETEYRKLLEACRLVSVPVQMANLPPGIVASTVAQPFRNALGQLSPPANAEIFVGREKHLKNLNAIWLKGECCIVQIVADGGVGKSALVWHWLDELKNSGYPEVFSAMDWSFYSQGQREYATDSQKFIQRALDHFWDLIPHREELHKENEEVRAQVVATAFAKCGGILILDGLEPLQSPPDTNQGRLKDPGLAAMLRRLRTETLPRHGSPKRLLIITTRWCLPDLVGNGMKTINLETLTERDGATLLTRYRLSHLPSRALNTGVETSTQYLNSELRKIVREYQGHSLALVLLASYLLRHHNGNVLLRHQLSLQPGDRDDDPYRHARRVMHGYDTMFQAEGSPLARACRQTLCMIGLFDRPAPLPLLEVVRSSEAMQGLTQGLTERRFRDAIDELRRLRLIAFDDGDANGCLETHPLVREHFGRVLEKEFPEDARIAHFCLFNYLRSSTMHLPDSLQDMEPLFQAVVHGCKAKCYRAAFSEVYLERIMRGQLEFSAVRLHAIGALLSVLSHFFQSGNWGQPVVESAIPEEVLSPQERLLLLLQSGAYLTATKGYSCHEVESIYKLAVSLAVELGDKEKAFTATFGLWRNQVLLGNASQASRHAEWMYSRMCGPTERVMAYRAQASSAVYEARFAEAGHYAMRALCENFECDGRRLPTIESLGLCKGHSTACVVAYQIGGCPALVSDDWIETAKNAAVRLVVDPVTSCRSYLALALWHLGQHDHAKKCSDLALLRARAIDHDHTLAVTLFLDNWLSFHFDEPATALDRATELVALCEDRGISVWLETGRLQLGWAQGMTGNLSLGIKAMRRALSEYARTEAALFLPLWNSLYACLLLKAESKQAIPHLREAIQIAEFKGQHVWKPDLHRLLGIALARFSTQAGNDLPKECKAAFKNAISLALACGSRSTYVRTSISFAECLNQVGRDDEAIASLQSALTSLGETVDASLTAALNAKLQILRT